MIVVGYFAYPWQKLLGQADQKTKHTHTNTYGLFAKGINKRGTNSECILFPSKHRTINKS